MITEQLETASLGALNALVIYEVSLVTDLVIDVSGTFTGTVTFTASTDGGVTYRGITALPSTATNLFSSYATGATAPGMWFRNDLCAAEFFRLQMTSYTSGTAVVRANVARRDAL